jgi:hypothetical protein
MHLPIEADGRFAISFVRFVDLATINFMQITHRLYNAASRHSRRAHYSGIKKRSALAPRPLDPSAISSSSSFPRPTRQPVARSVQLSIGKRATLPRIFAIPARARANCDVGLASWEITFAVSR